jgi:hypothetical protein
MALGDDYSPLSPLFDGTPPALKRRKRRTRRLLAAAAAIALVPTLSGTFASAITISSGDIEFGQGSAAASACDPAISIAINSDYSGSLEYFRIGSLTLSDLNTNEADLSTHLGCYGRTLTLRAFEGETEVDLNGGGELGKGLTYLVVGEQGTAETRDVTVAGDVDSSLVTRLTVETN